MALGSKRGSFKALGRWDLAAMFPLAVYLCAILWFSRFHVLDDALIHLRLAELFLEHGFFTADGAGTSFGTSSPVFVLLAAALHAAVETDLTTKNLSVVFYLGLLGGLATLVLRAQGVARLGWGAVLILMLMPMGVRWLTDGMETSLAVGLAVLLALATQTRRSTTPGLVALFFLGMVAVATRIEMTLLVALACLAIVTPLRSGAGRPDKSIGADRAWPAMLLALGAATSLLLVWLTFGAILPDTAVAKATGKMAPIASLGAILRSFGGALGFGIGLCLVWLAVFAVCLSQPGERRPRIFICNLALALLWGVISVRGQYVQGIRHVLPTMTFMIAACLAELSARPHAHAVDLAAAWLRPWPCRRSVARTTAAALGGIALLELTAFHEIVENRAAAFLEMRALNLAPLENIDGIGWDVGHVMYFSKARVCDVSGLVNGRTAASSPEPARLANCLKRDVGFAFVTREDAARLVNVAGPRFADWRGCGHYVFQNIRPTVPHYLVVSPRLAAHICPEPHDEGPLGATVLRAS